MTEVKVFDSAGKWIQTIGRKGGGPGEFEALGLVYEGPGDTIVTFEPYTQRVQVFDPDLEFVSLDLLVTPEGQAFSWVQGVLGDGSLLVSATVPDKAWRNELTARSRVRLSRAPRRKGTWDSIHEFTGGPQLRHPDYANSTWGSVLFASSPSYDSRGDAVVFATGDRAEIEVRGQDGRLRSILRRVDRPRSVSGAEFERALIQRFTGTDTLIRNRMIGRVRRASTSRIRPPIESVYLGADGRIWATYGDPTIGERPMATVFDPAGKWEADLEMPSGRILEVEADGVLISAPPDDDGFHHLRYYRLIRRPP
jgi:hypothetical protein